MAAVAGLAYKAYQNYQAGQKPDEACNATPPTGFLPPPIDSEFAHHAAAPSTDEFTLALVKAMIAAAQADGHVDAEETNRISEKLATSGDDEDAQQFIHAELAKPVDIDSLVDSARSKAQKVELYTGSRQTIDPQTRSERGYLDMLAGRLALPDSLVDHIEATIAGATTTG